MHRAGKVGGEICDVQTLQKASNNISLLTAPSGLLSCGGMARVGLPKSQRGGPRVFVREFLSPACHEATVYPAAFPQLKKLPAEQHTAQEP